MQQGILSRLMNCSTQIALFALAFAFGTSTGAANALTRTSTPIRHAEQIGMASWYGQREAGHRTASGMIFDPALKTAAHRTLPLGSCVRIMHLGNSRTLVVPVTDRGPYVAGRVIDLSQATARALGMERARLARVQISATACLRTALLITRAKDHLLVRKSVPHRGEKS
jgi:rare lipoprotein A